MDHLKGLYVTNCSNLHVGFSAPVQTMLSLHKAVVANINFEMESANIN